MTRHKHAQTGLVTPPLPQLLLTAALRMLAMLVHNVASTLQMTRRRTRVNATRATPTDLPQAKIDTQPKEPNSAAQHHSPPSSAHPEQRSFAARPSKDERVLTTPSVSLASRTIHLPQCSALMEANRAPMPATKGNCLHHSKSGRGGSPHLRGETEGAVPYTPNPGSGPSVRVPREGGDPDSSPESTRNAHKIASRRLWIPAFAGDAAVEPARAQSLT